MSQKEKEEADEVSSFLRSLDVRSAASARSNPSALPRALTRRRKSSRDARFYPQLFRRDDLRRARRHFNLTKNTTIKTKEIAKNFHLNQADFESFLLEIGANVKVGFTGMTLEDSLEDDVHSIVQKYYEYAERKKAERLEAEKVAAEAEKVAAEAEEKKRRALAKMPITSGFGFDGYRIRKYSDFISGDAAVSIDRGTHGFFSSAANVNQNLLASLGEIRAEALTKLKEAAYNLGCNAVVGVDFDYITLEPETANSTGGTTYLPYVFCVTVNGNAVVLEKVEK